MPDITTIAITVGSSAATALVVGLAISPRLEARNRRIQAAHIARDELGTQLRAILSACTRLRSAQIPASATAPVQAAIRTERERWRQQLDSATASLIDNFESFALTFRGQMGIRDSGIRTVGAMRFVWLSARREERKLEIIQELAGNLHDFYFAGFRSMLHPRRAIAARVDLQARLTSLEAGE
jgi:hypothetical protein